jgi:hypothetical protein
VRLQEFTIKHFIREYPMSYQKVDIASGLAWLTDAVNVALKNPAVFVVMGLIVAVISAVPLLGGLFLLFFGPAVIGGLVFAAREQDQGRTAQIGNVFQAFQEPGKLGPMLMLCLPSVAGAVVACVLVFVVLAAGLIGGAGSAIFNEPRLLVGALGGSAMIILPLALAIGLCVFALQFFAIPRVMLEGAEPMAAMKESFQACLANAGAFLVFVGLIGLGWFLIVTIFSVVHLWRLAPALANLVVYSLLGSGFYRAWRQIYGGVPLPTPPSAPSPPPPPPVA